MRRKSAFAIKLFFCCGYLFCSCNGGGSGNANKTDSTAATMNTQSMSKDSGAEKANHKKLSVVDTLTNYSKTKFTKIDSANFFVQPSYKSVVYPAIMTGVDFNTAY